MKRGWKICSLIIFISILCINTFYSAVVSDNDGAAFITKAEYDALTNTFQSTINGYNANIDNKINDAVNAYLTGIKAAKETTYTTVCYDSAGILAPRANYADLAWKEGTLELTIKFFLSNGSVTTDDQVPGAQLSEWNTYPASTFSELSVKNVDYVHGTASWNGEIESHQYVIGNSDDSLWNRNGNINSDEAKYASVYNGVRPLSNKTLAETSDAICHFQYTSSTNETWVNWGVFAQARYTNFTRTINSRKNDNIICVPQNVVCKRFSNVDEIRDWCNDDDTSGHTLVEDKLNVIFDESKSTATKYFYGTAGQRVGTKLTWNFDMQHNKARGSGNPAGNIASAKPYLGFVKPITDYNQLWTTKYDNYVSEIKKADSDASIFTDDDGNQHLWLYNGAPILEVNKNSTITIDLEFEDKTKNYDVWFKYGTFNKVNPNSDTDLVNVNDIYYGTKTDTRATVGSQSKSIRVPRGKQTVTIDLKKDSYLFIKWSLNGNGGAGGGRFMPPKTVKVTTSG